MKNRQSIVFWLAVIFAGLSVQMTALGLSPSYSTTQSSKFKIANVPLQKETPTGSCTFTNGDFDLFDGTYHYTGTYQLVNKGNKIAFTFDPSGVSTMEAALTSWVQAVAEGYGYTISDIVINIHQIITTKATISKTTGDPNKTIVTILGNIHATLNGHPATRSFTFNSKVTFSP